MPLTMRPTSLDSAGGSGPRTASRPIFAPEDRGRSCPYRAAASEARLSGYPAHQITWRLSARAGRPLVTRRSRLVRLLDRALPRLAGAEIASR